MSTTIDQKVVQMQFDNSNFEKNVSTSMSTLDKLKKALKFDGASKGLENVQKSADKVNFSGMQRGVEAMTQKFSYMQMTIQHQLNNIVDSAVNAGRRMVSALTIDPVKTGFQEYETQINAVQTILANTSSKGTTLDQVNQALDTLNTYADKTIYNFTEMTRNIGTFTAAGVDLDTSVSAIQGIANVAAVSGSTSQQASTAMYQLSQALATGTVKLMDWNSVVNAGMGGQVFQDALKQTSELLGTGAEAAIKAKGSFRESLQTGWLTAEVLTETLKKFTTSGANEYVAKYTGLSVEAVEAALESAKAQYGEADAIEQASKALAEKTGKNADEIESVLNMARTAEDAATKVKTFTQLWDTLKEAAQSGWTQTWEILIGDFEEAKELLTSISDTVGDVINRMSEKRNTKLEEAMTSNWDKLVGKINAAGVETDVFEDKVKKSLKIHGYDVEALIKRYGSLEKAFQSGAVSSDILKEAVDGLKSSFTDLSKVKGELDFGSEGEDVKQVQKALQGLGYDLGEFGADGKYGKATQEAIKAFQEANDLEITGIVDEDTLAKLKELNEGATNFGDTIYDLIANIKEIGGRAHIIESFKNIFSALADVIKPVGEAFREVFPETTWQSILKATQTFHDFTKKLKVTDETASKIKSTFKGLFSIISFVVDIAKAVGSSFISIISSLLGFSGVILDGSGALGDWITNMVNSAKENNIFVEGIKKITSIITGAIDKIKEFGSSLKENFKAPTAGGIFGFFTSLWNIISNVGTFIINTIGSVGGTIADAFGKGDIFEVLNSGLIAGIFLGIQKFTKSLDDVFDGAGGILENVTGILDDVRGCFKAYQEQLKAGTLIKIASAIAILAAAIFVISTIDADALGRSLGAITVLFGELLGSLAIFNKIEGKFKGTFKAIALMISISLAVLILASAMKKISEISWEGIAKGLVSIGALMAELSIFLRTAKFEGKMTRTALGIVLLSAAMVILSKAVKNFGAMKWEEIGKGLAAIGGLLLEISLFTKLTGNAKKVLSTGAAMVLLGASMKIFASAMKDFASMDWDQIGKGLLAMGGALAEVSIAMNLMPKGSLFKATGLVVAAAALKILASSLSDFGGMSLEQIGKGLVVVGGSLIELAIGLNLMKGTIKGSMALLIAAGALAILAPTMKILGGLSWEQIGKGLIVLAGAFLVIGVAGALLSPVIPAILGLSAAFLILGIGIAGIGAGLVLIGAGITSLSVSLAAGATSIVAGLTTIILGLLNLVPEIAKIIGTTILEVAAILGDYAPQLAESFCKLIVGVVDSLATYGPQLVNSLLDLLIDLINGLADHTPKLIEAFANLLGQVFKGVVDALNGADTANLLKGIAAVGLMGILAHVLAGVISVLPAAMAGLVGVGILIAELALILAAIGGLAQIPGLEWLINEGGDFLASIGNALGKAIGSLIGGIGEGLTGSLPEIGQNIADFMDKLAIASDNASGIKSGSFDGVSDLVSALGSIGLTTVGTSLSDIFTLGGTSMDKFEKDGVAFFNAMKAISEVSTGVTVDEASMSAVIGIATKLSDLQSSLTNMDGIISWFTGDKDLATFGLKVKEFMSSMITAVGSLEGVTINTEAIGIIIAAANKLSDLQSSLTNMDGILSWFTGDKDLATFGSKVQEFMASMVTAVGSLSDITINTEAIGIIIAAATKLSELQSSLTNMDGIISWFTGDKDLATFGTKVQEFMSSMVTAFGSLNEVTINTEAIGVVISAATKLSELQSSLTNMDGIISWFTGDKDLSTFGVKVQEFMSSMTTAFGSLGDVSINTEAIGIIISAATKLNELQSSLTNMDGIISWFTGDKDLSTFGIKVQEFISSMKTAFTDLGDTAINEESITSVINAATKLAELQSSLENMGGVISWFTGRSDLGTFGEKIGQFATAMGTLKTNMGENGISESVVTSVTNAGNALLALNDALPEEGWFDSKISMTTFSTYITDFSEAIGKFSENASSIDSSGIDNAINAAYRIKNLIGHLADLDTSGVTSFTGVGTGGIGADGVAYKIAQAMSAFSEKVAGIDTAAVSTASTAALKIKNLIAGLAGLDTSGVELFKPESIGKAMKSYADKVSGIDTAVVASSIASANRLKNFISSLSGLDSSGTSNFKPGSIGTALNTYSSNVSGIDLAAITNSISAGNKMKSFISSLAGLDTTGVSSFKTAISDLASVNISKAAKSLNSTSDLSSAGAKMMKSMSQGISTNASSVNTSVTKTLTSMMKNINSKADDFKRAGAKLMAGIASGLSSKADSVSTATKKAAADGASAIRNKYNSFYENGKYLGAGLVAGINAKQQSAWDAGYALGKAAVEGEKAGQQSNSPSKLTIKAGKWLGEGLVIGMERMARTVYKAGYSLGDSAVGTISSTIAKISDYVNEGVDAEPTIRPVLDLSDVRSGVNSIGDMLDMNSSIGVMSNIGAISTMMNSRNQNGANDDVISAINKLSKQLGNTGGNTYNINGVTYDDGSNVSNAVESLIRAARVERRI